MSRPIDEKIVKMKLDNSDFKTKATRTIGIFGKLTSAFGKISGINLKKPVSDLGQIKSTAESTNLNKLQESVQGISSKFSALSVVALSVLANIAQRAVSAGAQLVNSFTMKPIMDGFNEYELKMKSIQTIMSNTGGKNTLQDVTGTLDELNTYADQTIYNFAEMTRNIGTFTAAGVGLEDSAVSIKGIANLAAASGSSSEQASTAMYQLSQAISTGSVKLMDWNSVVNAGMGGKLFQNALEDTAKKLGKGRDESVSFRDSLQDGWITTEVLLKTLQDFSKDESMLEAATKVRTFTQLMDTTGEAIASGWAETFEIIVGDFNEAGEMWTKAADAIAGPIGDATKARNDLLRDFDKLGGTKSIVNSVSNAFTGLMKAISVIGDAFREVFPPATGESLAHLAKMVELFTSKLIMSDKTAAKVKTVFKGLFSILSIGWELLKLAGGAFKALIPDGLGGGLLDIAVAIAEVIIGLEQAIKNSDKATGAFNNIHDVVEAVAGGIGKFADFIVDVLKGSADVVTEIANALSPVFEVVKNIVDGLTSKLSVTNVINGGFIAALIIAVKKFSGLGGSIGDVIESLVGAIDNIGDSFSIFEDLGEALNAMTGNIKADSLIKIAGAVGILAVSLKLIASIKAQDLSKSLLTIAITMGMLTKSLGAISNSGIGIKNAISATIILPALATAILAMAAGLKIIASMDAVELAKGMTGLVGVTILLVGAVKSLSKVGPGMAGSAVGIVALSVSVVILASAVKKLSQIKASSLAKSVIALGIILTELSIFMKLANKSKLNPASAISLTITAAAVKMMVNAIEDISKISAKQLVKGLGTIALILAEMVIFSKLAGGPQVIASAVAMTLISGAINLMVKPIQELGRMSVEELAKGLISMALALGTVVVAMNLASGGILGAVAITAVAAAMNLLVPPIQALGNMSIEQLAKGLGAMAIGLTAIAIASRLIGLGGAVALLGLAAAIAAIGVAATGIALALGAFTTALTYLITTGIDNIDRLLKGFGDFIKGLTELIPLGVELIVTYVTELAKGLAEGIPVVARSAGDLVIGILEAMSEYVPKFIDTGVEFLSGLITAFSENIGPVIDSGIELITSLLNGMGDALEENNVEIVSSVLNLVEGILLIIVEAMIQVIDVLFGWIPGVSDTTREMGDAAKGALDEAFDVAEVGERRGGEFVAGIESNNDGALNAGKGLAYKAKDGADSPDMTGEGKTKGDEFISGLSSKSYLAQTKARQVANSSKTGAGSVSLTSTGSTLGSEFVNGVASKSTSSKTSGIKLANSGKYGAKSVSMSSAGRSFASGFAAGISGSQSTSWVSSAASVLAGVAKKSLNWALQIKSPSRVMMESGKYFNEGFALGIRDNQRPVSEVVQNMARGAVDTVKGYAETFNGLMNDNLDLNPTITPIMDMSNVDRLKLSSRLKVNGIDTSNLDPRQRSELQSSNGDNVTNEYHVHVTAYGNLPQPTIRSMAKKFQQEIKNMKDQEKLSKGQEVAF